MSVVPHALGALLRPKAIAILGASPNFSKVNGRPIKHLLDKGYAGVLYPVNPKYQQVAGLECFPSIGAIPGPVDLAIVAVPAREVAGAIAELGKKGIPAAVILSSGFSERGEEGRILEQQLTATARIAGVRVCGPNCMGLINAFDKVLATFSQYAEGETAAGPVGFVTQSGAFGTAIAALARRRNLGLGFLVNTGNECDIDFAEVMGEILKDPRIKLAAGYLEGLENPNGLKAVAAAALELAKPLILIKVGRSAAGARAAAAHTGSVAGDAQIYDGIAKQFGIVQARNEEHMLDMVEVFVNCELPRGNGVGLITMSGGAGVLMADRAEEAGLDVPILGAETQQALRTVLPDYAAFANPVDLTGQFLVDPPILRDSILITLADAQVDVGIVWLQLMESHVDVLCRVFGEAKARATKPFVVCWVAAPEAGIAKLREQGLAVLRGAEPAVDAVSALVTYAISQRR